jgi:hypothetical protein
MRELMLFARRMKVRVLPGSASQGLTTVANLSFTRCLCSHAAGDATSRCEDFGRGVWRLGPVRVDECKANHVAQFTPLLPVRLLGALRNSFLQGNDPDEIVSELTTWFGHRAFTRALHFYKPILCCIVSPL